MRPRILRVVEHRDVVIHELHAIHADFIQTAWAVCSRQDLITQLLTEIRDALKDDEDGEVTEEALVAARDRLDRLVPTPRKKGTPDDLEELYRRWIV